MFCWVCVCFACFFISYLLCLIGVMFVFFLDAYVRMDWVFVTLFKFSLLWLCVCDVFVVIVILCCGLCLFCFTGAFVGVVDLLCYLRFIDLYCWLDNCVGYFYLMVCWLVMVGFIVFVYVCVVILLFVVLDC